MKRRVTALAIIPFACGLAAAAPATALALDEPTPEQTAPWPDEGHGYPGYGDQPAPTDDVNQATALDTSSVVLGALGGIAIGGVALGTTLVVQRRRDHATSAHA